MRQKKQYPVWDNYRYAFYYMRKKEGMGSIAVCVFDAVCSILLPFLEAALAGAVAACLVSGKRPQEILLMILGYVALLQGVRFLQSHLRVLRDIHLMLFRGGMGMEYFRKTLEMDGQSLESSTGQGKRAAASRNIFTGNNLGIEAYVKSFCDMVISFGGLVIYSVIIGRKGRFWSCCWCCRRFLPPSCTPWLAGGPTPWRMRSKSTGRAFGICAGNPFSRRAGRIYGFTGWTGGF